MISSYYPKSKKILSEIDLSAAVYQSDLVHIEGVVSPESQGAYVEEEFKVHMFSLVAWKFKNDSTIHQKELLILRTVELDRDFFKDIKALAIISLTVYLDTNNVRAVFESGSINENSINKEWLQIVEDLEKPVVIETQLFGILKLDQSIGWFSGKGNWNGINIELSFPIDENRKITKGLEMAEAMWKDQKKWKEKVDDFAVEKLLNLKNESWLDEDEKELTAEEFKSKMKLESITFESDGSFDFWHNDGDLFWGHAIQISGNLNDGLTDADIPG